MTLSEELEQLGVDKEKMLSAAKRELKRRQNAQRYLDDPFLFMKYACTDPDPDPVTGVSKRDQLNLKLHGGGLQFINSPSRRKLILWPRGHLKSTTFTVCESLRRAIKNPNIRILLSSAKNDNSRGFLSNIKEILRKPYFIELYGDLLPGPNDKTFKNNSDTLCLMTKTSNFTQSTWTCTGSDAEKTSQHYDLIIHDDVVNRENVSNEDQMNKVIQYYQDCVSLLDPKREMWVIGTRWHPLDLYGWILDNADPRCKELDFQPHHELCTCKFAISIRKLTEDGVYIFPEKFDDEVLHDLVEMDKLDRYGLACQYYNNPVDASTCWFKASDIEASLIEPHDILTDKKGEKRHLQWFAAIDPAESVEARACLSAAVAVGVDTEDGTWYVDYAEGRRVETEGFVSLCMDTWERYRPSIFGMELNTRKHLAFLLKQRMLETGNLFTITELKPQKVGDAKRTKNERIKRLVPLFEHKKIRVNKLLKPLIDELHMLPNSNGKDLSDALSYILDIVPPGLGYRKSSEIKTPRRHIHWKGIGY